MNIELNKEFIKEVKKELRNKRNSLCGTYIRIDAENKLIRFSFNRYNNSKYSNDKKVNIVLEDKIDILNNYADIKRIHLHNIMFNDVFLDVLLSENVSIKLYKKNCDGFVSTKTNTECYMSTIIIYNHKKYATYNTICNRHCDMIVD